jgi:hypothetical protein
MNTNYKDPVTFYYDGEKISKTEAMSKMTKAGCDNHVQRCTMWELLNENAQKGDERAIELLKHMTMTDSREQ